MADGRSQSFTEASVPNAYRRFMLSQLFEPWATELVSRSSLHDGQSVLDVASGLGPVARLAAAAVGSQGRVVASDISAAMLKTAEAMPARPSSALIEYLECSASALSVDDGAFDVVMCQQGLQFFPDRALAIREMRRAVRPGGTVVVSTWAGEHPLGLFGPMTETLDEAGVVEPYPGAYDPRTFVLSSSELVRLFDEAGLGAVKVETVELDARWASMDEAVATLMATPFGPFVSALSTDQQHDVAAGLAARLDSATDGTVVVRTASNIVTARRADPLPEGASAATLTDN